MADRHLDGAIPILSILSSSQLRYPMCALASPSSLSFSAKSILKSKASHSPFQGVPVELGELLSATCSRSLVVSVATRAMFCRYSPVPFPCFVLFPSDISLRLLPEQ